MADQRLEGQARRQEPRRPAPRQQRTVPARAGLVLVALILVAAVANLNLAVANVALPDIGKAFDSSQTTLDLIAVGYSLGLAGVGAVPRRARRPVRPQDDAGPRVSLSVPACLLAAYAPTDGVLVVARLLGGLSAGMAYPTTLALITALWSGPARTKSIALWSGIGGAISALGPLVPGALLEHFWWGSVFLVTLPLAVVALVLALRFVPSHVNEATDPVDNLGGILSVLVVAALVLAINFAPVPDKGTLALGLAVIALAAGVAFVIRQRRARNPALRPRHRGPPHLLGRGVAGIIVFGSLMGAMFIGQQFLQNVLGYSTLEPGAAILPAAVLMVIVAPRSAKLVEARGARFTLLLGYVFCLLGFIAMLLLWKRGQPLLGGRARVRARRASASGFAGTPASHSLTGSVPVRRAGMASGTADLQRDLGGAIMQSILGALLTAGYATAFAKAIAASPNGAAGQQQRPEPAHEVVLERGDSCAAVPEVLQADHRCRQDVVPRRRQWAYSAGIVAILLGRRSCSSCSPGRGGGGAARELPRRRRGRAGGAVAGPRQAPEMT